MIAFFLTGCSTRDKPAPVASIYSAVPLNERVKNSINASEYVVRAGETLYSIAWRANSDVRQLAKLNKIYPPYRIYPGQKLLLVAKSSAKDAKASTSKALVKNSTNRSSQTSIKTSNKAIASTKKQAYGKNVRGQKIPKKASDNQSDFSQKISRWQWPVKGKIIEYFSTRAQGNKGINIAGRRGTNIKAAAEGKVVYAGSALRGYGKLIIIKHNDDYLSAYAHNDKILVKEQQVVKSGQVVAKMGDTDATQVMLHFEVRFRGKSVNPLNYLPKKQ
ncbi:peptidoglycan DD-metalloendopeptidase family protein [Litorilituus sediminis]|uniref:LysM peptidoglycan-binding domain-containing protein n=1 Tax=Litorilituus sediminis TaxID=718192 RepID=A0A4P6P7N7_9GAMM|nr:peptidoglycan DD-metalloendopeptidase family protein [Litorilituus sediminis]QBG35465.1 LysM peptidoglycan-binding domain-containing protein [Litorilituus sediminis]